MDTPPTGPNKDGVLIKMLPYLVLLLATFTMFAPFFINGYVLNGDSDRTLQIIPFRTMYLRSFQDYEIPQWNPYIFCGTSAMGSALYDFFYPPYWIIFLFSERYLPFLLTVLLPVHFVAAGIFSFLFFRQLTDERFWALSASMMYLLSSASVSNMTEGIIDFSHNVYLPLLLYLAYSQNRRRYLTNIACQTPVLTMLLLSGNPHLSLYAVTIYFLIAIYKSAYAPDSSLKAVLRRIAPTIISIILALGISAVRFIPFYCAIESYGNMSASYDVVKNSSSTHIAYLLRLFLPEFFGDTFLKFRWNIGSDWGVGHHGETFSCYAGVLCSLFGLYSLLFIWNRNTIPWNLAIILIILIVLGTPVLKLHYLLTGKASLQYRKLAWFLPLCFSALFAINGRRLIQDKRKAMSTFIAIVSILILSAAYLVYKNYYPENVRLANAAIIKFSVIYFVASCCCAIGVIYLMAKRGLEDLLAGFLLFILIAADVAIIAKMNSNYIDPFLVPGPLYKFSRKKLAMSKELKKLGNQFRGLCGGDDTNIVLNFYNISGYDNSAPSLICRLNKTPNRLHRVEVTSLEPANLRIMQLGSTAYSLGRNGLKKVDGALPRTRLFTSYLVVTDDETAITKLWDPGFDFNNTVILNKEPGLPISHVREPGYIQITRDLLNNLEMAVEARANSVLLLNDSYAPEWRVFIDGRPADLMRGNFAFRAVGVPAGRHRIRFSYTHKGIKIGSIITILSLTLYLGIFARLLRER